jgi:hypothetical protein
MLLLGVFLLVGMALCGGAGTGPVGKTNQVIGSMKPTVGMEGRLEVMLPGTMLEAKPVNPRSPLVVRIAGTRPHGSLIDYDLRYIGLVPGKYDLREYFVRKDGSSTADLPMLAAEVAGVLPESHRGELFGEEVQPLPFLGGYRTALTLVVALWAFLFVPFWLSSRKPKAEPSAPLAVAPPTLAERLQPLVKRAAEGKLSKSELAQLERMLLNHWRERLGLQELGLAEAVGRLREHPEGGALLRELENWLHRPPGTTAVNVAALLAPYGALTKEAA